MCISLARPLPLSAPELAVLAKAVLYHEPALDLLGADQPSWFVSLLVPVQPGKPGAKGSR